MVDNDDAIEGVRDGLNRLRGRLFGAIEAVGLPLKQENAIKGLIRSASYDVQSDLESILRRT